MHARKSRLVALALGLSALFVSVGAEAQRRMDEPAYNEAVQALSAADADARIAAVEAIARGGWRFRRQAAPHLRRLIRHDPDWRVRASSGRAIGRLSLREAVPDLVRALRDPQVDVRIVAAAALWRLPDAAAVPALLDLLNDADPTARQWGALALGVTGDTRATEALLRLMDDPAPAVRLDALRSLGRVADPAALERLVAFIVDVNRPEDERLEAINALASLRGPDKMNALIRLLDDANTNVRLHVVNALGQVGDALTVPTLRRRRGSETVPAIRTAIDEAITAIEERARERAAEAAAGN
ncbi:MAG: HEAT repeat domain-containing protein [Polyangiales bacterium]|nr:HEAT repeat domain-containing protein [Myxococcales bacterium]MCB9659072.1 HEAT repeat domain-containing protein [Sandaracinaceae bacterium]